jgi:outer membrane autotransporter protein
MKAVHFGLATVVVCALVAVCLGHGAARAQSATWAGPGADWNTNTNWSPLTVPTGTAIFAGATPTTLTFSAATTSIGILQFNAGGPAYTFELAATNTLNITGTGVVNNSANVPTFTGTGVFSGTINFQNASTAANANFALSQGLLQFENTSNAGTATITNTIGGDARFPGSIEFHQNSSAAGATITIVGTTGIPGAVHGANLAFLDNSTAGTAHITVDQGICGGGIGVCGTGVALFVNQSTAGNATIINQNGGATQFGFDTTDTPTAGNANITNSASGGTSFLAASTAGTATIINNSGGTTTFGLLLGTDTATAGNAHITNNAGGTTEFVAATTAGNAVIVNNAGGFLQFGTSGGFITPPNVDTASAGNATITNNGTVSFNSLTTAGNATITTNSGGHVFFFDDTTGGTARFITNAGGTFDMSGLGAASMTAGSIEGAGSYVLGNKQLVVGGNGLSTTVEGVISGIGGSLDKVGAGTLTLTGNNTYTGITLIDGGILSVNGSIAASNVFVDAGGTLGGNGIVGPTTVNSGGIVAPGNSIGTLTVAGDIAFHPGSIYQMVVNAAGQTDLIVATTAHLTGGTVQVLPLVGAYGMTTQYVIVQTTGGVTGTFSNVTSSSAFLTPSLSYPTDEVVLTLTRNAASFASIAQTPNQSSVAAALGASPFGSTLVQAILPLSTTQALQAFDALSGEIHASVQTAMIDDGLFVRDALLDRMLQAAYVNDGGAMAALGAGGPTLAYADATLARLDRTRQAFPIKAPAPAASPDLVFWAQGVGAWGHVEGDGNAAEMNRTFAGFLTGVDRRFGDDWRAGIAAGYSNSSVSVNARASSANIDTAHLAAYAAAGFGDFKLRTGAAFSWNTASTDRTIVFPGFADTAHANYGAGEPQLFGELGYGMAFGHLAVEPFAGLAWVHLGTQSFTESGGAAALAGASNHDDVGYTTLGARVATRDLLPNGMVLTPHVSLAYQRALGNVTPAAVLAFESTGVGTEITGVPLARDSALVQVGADLQINRQASFGAFYSGELAGSAQDHSVNGRFVWRY